MIIHHIRKSRSTQSGQAIVLMALAMVALLAFTALAIDGGRFYAQRRAAQNAADMSSLAGVQYYYTHLIPTAPTDNLVMAEISRVAVANGIAPGNTLAFWIDASGRYIPNTSASGCSGAAPQPSTTEPPPTCAQISNLNTLSKPAAAYGIRVRTSIPYGTFLGGFMGHSTLTAQADGVALRRLASRTYTQMGSRSIWTGGSLCDGTNGNPGIYAAAERTSNNQNWGAGIYDAGSAQIGNGHWGGTGITGSVTIVNSATNPLDNPYSYAYYNSSNPPPGGLPPRSFPDWAYLRMNELGANLPPADWTQIQAWMFQPTSPTVPNAPASASALGPNYIFQGYVAAVARGDAPAGLFHYIADTGNAATNGRNFTNDIPANPSGGVWYVDGDVDISTLPSAWTTISSTGVTFIAKGKVTMSTGNPNSVLGYNTNPFAYGISILAGGGAEPPTSPTACAGSKDNAIFKTSGQQAAWQGILYVPNGLAVIDTNYNNGQAHAAYGPIIAYSFGNGYEHPANNQHFGTCTSCFVHPTFNIDLHQ